MTKKGVIFSVKKHLIFDVIFDPKYFTTTVKTSRLKNHCFWSLFGSFLTLKNDPKMTHFGVILDPLFDPSGGVWPEYAPN